MRFGRYWHRFLCGWLPALLRACLSARLYKNNSSMRIEYGCKVEAVF